MTVSPFQVRPQSAITIRCHGKSLLSVAFGKILSPERGIAFRKLHALFRLYDVFSQASGASIGD